MINQGLEIVKYFDGTTKFDMDVTERLVNITIPKPWDLNIVIGEDYWVFQDNRHSERVDCEDFGELLYVVDQYCCTTGTDIYYYETEDGEPI